MRRNIDIIVKALFLFVTMNKTISILIADDHRLFRSGLISLLENIHNMIVIDECDDGEKLIPQYFELSPDIIITDISMPSVSGFEALKEIRKRDPQAKALFLTMYDSEEYIYYARKIGGKGLLGKNIRKDELVYAITTIAEGNEYFGRKWTPEKLTELDEKYETLTGDSIEPKIGLSSREKEILLMISDGMTSNEIAEELNLSKRTIDNHRYRLMKRVGAQSLPQLIAYAIKFAEAADIKKKLDE